MRHFRADSDRALLKEWDSPTRDQKPMIGIVNSQNDVISRSSASDDIMESVKAGVGGGRRTPFQFPALRM